MGTGRDGSVSDVDPGLNVRGWDALAPGIWRGGPEDAPQLAVVGGIHGDETAAVPPPGGSSRATKRPGV